MSPREGEWKVDAQTQTVHSVTGGRIEETGRDGELGRRTKERQTGELNTHRDNGDRHMQKQRGADTCVSERLIGPDMSLHCSDACSLLAGMSSQRG